jgi:acyl dehydratase
MKTLGVLLQILPKKFPIRLMSTLEIGQKASLTRKITQEDVDKFSSLSGDTNAIHAGPKAVVHGAFLNSLVSCVMGTKMPGPGSMVVSQAIKYPNPCRVGDFVEVSVILTGMKMDLIKCRYTIMAKPEENSPLAESKLVLTGDANLIMAENQKKRAKRKKSEE